MEYRFNASPVYTFDVERGQRAVKKQRLRMLLLPLLPLLLLLLLLLVSVTGRSLLSLIPLFPVGEHTGHLPPAPSRTV